MKNRNAIITEALSAPLNQTELANAFQQLNNAIAGEWGSGDWKVGTDIGWYVKQGNVWSGQIKIISFPSSAVQFPFLVSDTIVELNDLSNVVNVSTTKYYIQSGRSFSALGLVGRTVMVKVLNSPIVRDK